MDKLMPVPETSAGRESSMLRRNSRTGFGVGAQVSQT